MFKISYFCVKKYLNGLIIGKDVQSTLKSDFLCGKNNKMVDLYVFGVDPKPIGGVICKNCIVWVDPYVFGVDLKLSKCMFCLLLHGSMILTVTFFL